ncbi:Os04g0389000, partial [Oryza sativa Japonica Group]
VEYKPGTTNVVADALSRRDEHLAEALALSAPQFSLFDELRHEVLTSPELTAIRDDIAKGSKPPAWAFTDGLITFKGRIFVSASSPSLPAILELAHGLGHEGTQNTLSRLRADFHLARDRAVVQEHARACFTCQQNKTEHLQPAGLLQSLPVPSAVWADIAMDFVEGLPRVHGKTVILTVVDRFSKFAHFIPMAHPYTATSVAAAFFSEIVRLHGVPASIVSDRDPVFTSTFWRELFRLAGVRLNLSSAFHPQSDGQSEVTNKIIAMYLRCLTGDRPRHWLRWLPWAEYCYNTSYQSSLRTSPFRVVYGREPPTLRAYEPGSTRLLAVQQAMQDRDEFLREIRDRLEQAQQTHKSAYDGKHRALEFSVGDWLWLRLLHRPIASLGVTGRGKLGPKFYGLYRVAERIGSVAYRLQLPPGARLHDVFHVRLLKPFCGTPPDSVPPLPPIQHGQVCLQPAAVTQSRLARGVRQVLVQWKDKPSAEASWMPLDEFRTLHPDFQLEDELLLQGGEMSCGDCNTSVAATGGRRQGVTRNSFLLLF